MRIDNYLNFVILNEIPYLLKYVDKDTPYGFEIFRELMVGENQRFLHNVALLNR